MTKTIDDGGPAFPRTVQRWNDSLDYSAQGMSLRDYFAGQALAGLLAQSNGSALQSDVVIGARWAYRMADALLSERKGGA